MNLAVILASGLGKRMGAGKNKVLLHIGKKPIIFYTVSAFEKNPKIDRILVTSKDSEIEEFKKLFKKYKFKKVIDVISGGIERQDSAWNALRYLKENGVPKNSIAIFHNGANPFVAEGEIGESIEMAKKYGASVAAHPAKDTIKEISGNGMIVKTLDRKKLWNMQTPQTIKFDLAYNAFSKAYKDKFYGTDDVSLVERLGKKVKIVEASQYNFKITTPMDLELAEIILKKYHK